MGEDSNERILQAPPVKRMLSIYGINLETETAYFYTKNPEGGGLPIRLSEEIPTDIFHGYKIRKGIVYETSETPVILPETGLEVNRSGDGTVPYASLSYCKGWKKQIPDLKIIELEQVEHRSMLSNRVFFNHLIDYIAHAPLQFPEVFSFSNMRFDESDK